MKRFVFLVFLAEDQIYLSVKLFHLFFRRLNLSLFSVKRFYFQWSILSNL